MTRQDPSLGNQEKLELPWFSQKIIFFILSKMSTGIHAGSTFTHIYWYFNCFSSGAEKQGQVNLSSKELEAKLCLALWLSPFFLFFSFCIFFPLMCCNSFIDGSVVCMYGKYNIGWYDWCRTCLNIWTRVKLLKLFGFISAINMFVSCVLLNRHITF